MDSEFVLTALLVVSLLFAVMLVLISSGTLGRKLADLEFQQEAGIDGIRGIQSWINVRTHANRVFLGMSFIVINALLLAGAPIEWRTWTNRVLFALLMMSYTVCSLADWRAERKQMQLLQAMAQTGQAQAFADGVKVAEDKAEVKAEALARVAVVPPAPGIAAVAIESISSEAVGDIVEAIQPAVTESAIEALTTPRTGGSN